MGDIDSERQDERDLLLVLMGLALAVSIQSLIEALKTVNSLFGLTPIQYLGIQISLFVLFLIMAFALIKQLPKVGRAKSPGS